ncbi:MAG: Rpn family recombination-promoting nuclease/putative transposase [Peptococcaceae bacterium]|nr:Rpn family recombination-promoting nuclease/putative transposase [Peptococcaceae bacterium]MBQ3509096.1 Rpn family recombination-promoting nuclease/putative transposase [Peptococcaceae bacterium]
MKTLAEQKALVSQLNLMDDLFFHKVAEDSKACEEILRIILKKPDLKVNDCQPQRYLRNIEAHSVILDVLCTDESGRIFNIEVQKEDNDAHQRRVRFNISNVDTAFMEKGLHYRDFPDVCVVFISKFDMFDMNQTLYHVCRVVKGTDKYVENGTHEVYVNTMINDGSDIAELMQYFADSNGYHENFKTVCNRVNYLKHSDKGVQSMSSVIEEYKNKCVQEEQLVAAKNMFKEGLPLEVISRVLPSLSSETLLQLQKNISA